MRDLVSQYGGELCFILQFQNHASRDGDGAIREGIRIDIGCVHHLKREGHVLVNHVGGFQDRKQLLTDPLHIAIQGFVRRDSIVFPELLRCGLVREVEEFALADHVELLFAGDGVGHASCEKE